MGTNQTLIGRRIRTSHGSSGRRSLPQGPAVTTAVWQHWLPVPVRVSTPFTTGTISRTGV
ncbi:hypothetical protein [Streptomyces sp. VNUA24]|uniref:hypothetical protein n=1 Tax=Streptomyces sp. VNUA24 TaxID=3031131 RepID=UPI0023B827BF|nr:hypothetical protein [Streptomyces sp. VNUA24]WEH19826.1 hypothetical protein PYR72_41605 [Streptomyces sp. VNUA24]